MISRASLATGEQPGVLVIGSEVPNLLRCKGPVLVVSQHVDIGVPVGTHAVVRQQLKHLEGLHPSPDEPSVWLPDDERLIEVNSLGMDPSISDTSETDVLEDDERPLLVFGQLSLMRPGPPVRLDGGLSVPVPRAAGLLLEKLITDRSGDKGDRDLLVVAGLLLTCDETDLDELSHDYRRLAAERQHAVRANLSILSLMQQHEGMPDPVPLPAQVARLLHRLETEGAAAP